MAENFPKLMVDTKSQIQEVQRTLNKTKKKGRKKRRKEGKKEGRGEKTDKQEHTTLDTLYSN